MHMRTFIISIMTCVVCVMCRGIEIINLTETGVLTWEVTNVSDGLGRYGLQFADSLGGPWHPCPGHENFQSTNPISQGTVPLPKAGQRFYRIELLALGTNAAKESTSTPSSAIVPVASPHINGVASMSEQSGHRTFGILGKRQWISATIMQNESTNVDSRQHYIIKRGRMGGVHAIAVEKAGTILVGGTFSEVNGVPCNNIARLNADGSVDKSFDVGTGPNNDVEDIAVLASGRIVLVGTFTDFNDRPAFNIAVLKPDGRRDETFQDIGWRPYNSDHITHVTPLKGEQFIVGIRRSFGLGSAVMLCSATGTMDTSFESPAAYCEVHDMKIDARGRIWLGGSFFSPSLGKFCLWRLNGDGTLDNSFKRIITTSVVNSIVILPDDGAIIGGDSMSTEDGNSCGHLCRVKENGEIDPRFDGKVATHIVPSLVPHGDNMFLLVTGSLLPMRSIDDRGRLTSNKSYMPKGGWGMELLVPYDGNKVIVGGGDTLLNRRPVMGLDLVDVEDW